MNKYTQKDKALAFDFLFNYYKDSRIFKKALSFSKIHNSKNGSEK